MVKAVQRGGNASTIRSLFRNPGMIRAGLGGTFKTVKDVTAELSYLQSMRDHARASLVRGRHVSAANQYIEIAEQYLAIGEKLHGIMVLLEAYACLVRVKDSTCLDKMSLIHGKIIQAAQGPGCAREHATTMQVDSLDHRGEIGQLTMRAGGTPTTVAGVTAILHSLQTRREAAHASYRPRRSRDEAISQARKYETIAEEYLKIGEKLNAIRDLMNAHDTYLEINDSANAGRVYRKISAVAAPKES